MKPVHTSDYETILAQGEGFFRVSLCLGQLGKRSIKPNISKTSPDHSHQKGCLMSDKKRALCAI